jgi:hypothetical protein
MHDCRKMKGKLIDLLFNEAAQDEKLRLISEVDGCDECLEVYRSMAETLNLFDRAVEAGTPEEGFWQGYEDRLRVRLVSQPRPSGWRLTLDRLRGFGDLFMMPLPVKTALALLILASALWLAFFRQAGESIPPPDEIAKPVPVPVPQVIPPERVTPNLFAPNEVIAHRPRRKAQAAASSKEAVGGSESSGRPARRSPSMLLLSAETANHIEKTELLLRAFRNIRPTDDRAGFDISYEKRVSRELVAKNMLLRRRAGNKDERIAEELLASVEPILVDIANMPERASEGDVGAVKELMRKQEIISALQLFSARAMSQVLNRENYDTP